MPARRVMFRVTPAFEAAITTLGLKPDTPAPEVRDALVKAISGSRQAVDRTDLKYLQFLMDFFQENKALLQGQARPAQKDTFRQIAERINHAHV